jgi:hypothetical protein
MSFSSTLIFFILKICFCQGNFTFNFSLKTLYYFSLKTLSLFFQIFRKLI